MNMQVHRVVTPPECYVRRMIMFYLHTMLGTWRVGHNVLSVSGQVWYISV